MTPSQLSNELREGGSPDLSRRRATIILSLVGCAAGAIVGLYQTGVIKRLPDLPTKPFDSNRVNASDYAYKRFKTPDAFMMLFSYSITAWLAAAGGRNRAQTDPALPIATTLKAVSDVAVALELGREEWQENKALCAYCQAATVASLITVALTIPETLRALGRH